MTGLKHHGVKGMKWGVRRDRNRPGGADGKWESEKIVDKRNKLTKVLDSMKRERQWHRVLREMDKMATKDITSAQRRISLENSLKSLSKSKVGTKKDKEDYLRREKMSDQELSRKVTRLRAKESLYRSVKEASKEQREFGVKAAKVGGSLGYKFAMTKKLGPADFLEAIHNPTIKTKQDAWDSGIKVVESRATNEKVKRALETAKGVKFKSKS